MLTDIEVIQTIDTKTLVEELARRLESDITSNAEFDGIPFDSFITIAGQQFSTMIVGGMRKEFDENQDLQIDESFRIVGSEPYVSDALLLAEGMRKQIVDSWYDDRDEITPSELFSEDDDEDEYA